MNDLRRLKLLLLGVAALMLAATTARASSFSLTLAAPFQSGAPGQVLTFDATVTNNSGATVFLNADSFSLTAPLTLDDSDFFNNYPLSLANGGSYTGDLFTVQIPGGTSPGLYAGSFELIGGADSNATNDLGSVNFDVNVTPEPSSLLLLATGMVGLGGTLRRRLVG